MIVYNIIDTLAHAGVLKPSKDFIHHQMDDHKGKTQREKIGQKESA
jgi:hypothetical protein